MLRYVGNNNEIILFKSLIFRSSFSTFTFIDLVFSIQSSNREKTPQETMTQANQVKRCINILIQRKSLNNRIFYGSKPIQFDFFFPPSWMQLLPQH